MITQKELKEFLNYDHETGIFRWKKKPWMGSRVVIGGVVGSKDTWGYLRVSLKGVRYKLHRLAFLYINGKLPLKKVDHINGNTADNRWSNLRLVSVRQNQQNTNAHRKGKLVGACYVKGKWLSRIQINGKNIYLGSYGTEIEAHKAYMKKYNEIIKK